MVWRWARILWKAHYCLPRFLKAASSSLAVPSEYFLSIVLCQYLCQTKIDSSVEKNKQQYLLHKSAEYKKTDASRVPKPREVWQENNFNFFPLHIKRPIPEPYPSCLITGLKEGFLIGQNFVVTAWKETIVFFCCPCRATMEMGSQWNSSTTICLSWRYIFCFIYLSLTVREMLRCTRT